MGAWRIGRKGSHRGRKIKEIQRKIWEDNVHLLSYPVLFFRQFFGIWKQILAEILSKVNILAELDEKFPELDYQFAELGQYFA